MKTGEENTGCESVTRRMRYKTNQLDDKGIEK